MLRHGLQGFNGERVYAPRAAELRPPRTSWPSGSSCSGRRGVGGAACPGVREFNLEWT
jgi:hypothetical protein